MGGDALFREARYRARRSPGHGLSPVFSDVSARPEHPDFWRLSEIVLALDAKMDAATTEAQRYQVWLDVVGESVDFDSVSYMAIQRAMRVLGITTREQLRLRADEAQRIAAVYCEGFVVGSTFTARP
jgi:hypothetical protein